MDLRFSLTNIPTIMCVRYPFHTSRGPHRQAFEGVGHFCVERDQLTRNVIGRRPGGEREGGLFYIRRQLWPFKILLVQADRLYFFENKVAICARRTARINEHQRREANFEIRCRFCDTSYSLCYRCTLPNIITFKIYIN
jgi:hypothetical protein